MLQFTYITGPRVKHHILQGFVRNVGDLLPDLACLPIDKMMKEFSNLTQLKTDLLKRYFEIFLLYLTSQYKQVFQTAIKTRNLELVERFMTLLEKISGKNEWRLSMPLNCLSPPIT